MTDNASDNNGNKPFDPPASGNASPLNTAESETGGDADNLAIHIVEPDDPGTILVATAEPPDAPQDQTSLCEADAFPGEQAGAGEPVEQEGATSEPVLPAYDSLAEVVAVRLGGLGPALFFTANGIACGCGDAVIVDMEEGLVFGTVSSVMRMNPEHLETGQGEGAAGGKIRPVARKATDKDVAAAESNTALAAEALEYCRECIRERDLDMKLVDVLILHDRGKMVFYFTAPARIDFRELVKDLVRRYRTRIELRQIGVRHETQMIGALGNCGMVCCCRRYLRKFAPVAIKMAKEQNVFLNPVKISGICGRLLCCLAYEQEHYDEFYRSCPKLGKKYHTDAGVMRVLRASLFRESVTVLSETGEEIEYALAEWNNLNPFRPNAGQQQAQSGKKQEQAGDKARKGGRGPQASRQEKSGTEQEPPSAPVRHGDEPRREERKHSGPVSHAPFAEADSAGEPDMGGENRAADGGDGGGSIFGLSPQRHSGAEHEADSESAEGENAEGAFRRRRPPRRGGRPKPQSGS